jgi:hypothetical protein
MSDETNKALLNVSDDEFVRAAMGNKGFTKDEGVIPFTKIMQPLSPEVGTVPMATPGVFLNAATNKVSRELLVVPVDIRWSYTEWVPRDQGGGFVQDWGENELGWQDKCEADQKFAYQPVTKDGHNILRGRHVFMFSVDEIGDFERTIFPMAGTALKVAKQWSTMLEYAPKVNTSKGMITPAYFYYTYRIVSEEVKNSKGRWFVPKVTANISDNKYQTVFDLPNGKAIWEAAVKLRNDLVSGEAKASAQVEGNDPY